jgi:hypothetical protein
MTMRKSLLASACLSMLFAAGAAHADNLALNPDFTNADTRALVSNPPPTTDFTETLPNAAVNYAAAQDWLIWAGYTGGHVRTALEPSLDWPGNNVLHVWVDNAPGRAGIDQVFLPIHTGPQHAWFCATVKIVKGTMGAGANDQGNGTFTAGPVAATGGWIHMGGESSTPPVNQIFFYAGSPHAEFYIKNVQVSTMPIACEQHVTLPPHALPQTLFKPDPLPWTLHPEQGAVQPSGNPAQGGQASPSGYYEGMAPGASHNDSEGGGHEATRGGGGGKTDKGSKTGPAGNTIQSTTQGAEQQQSTPQ